ncbi:UNVERIFIED_CONTAM: hypothetical protein HDU68_003535 [Siphonaria sp. JEL0065]|nr:hypothetical protein HDU68_003535 [Siphonaria sp. JEL0065]
MSRKRQSSNSSLSSFTIISDSPNSATKRLRQGSNLRYSPLLPLKKPGILKRSRSCSSQLDLDVEAALKVLSLSESASGTRSRAVSGSRASKKQHVTFGSSSTNTIYATDTNFNGDFTYNFNVIMADDSDDEDGKNNEEITVGGTSKESEDDEGENTNMTYIELIREAQRRIEEID